MASRHTLNFGDLAAVADQFSANRIFLFGLVFVMAGLGFKIAVFPFQIWVPDVYQGAPSPTTAFLAVGSKAAGFVLLLRVLFIAVPAITAQWANLLIILSGITILYGNLCAIPQRNLKRLLGYSSIAHAGYVLLGVAALSAAGRAAMLYYLSGYLFTVLGAFTVICLVMLRVKDEDIRGLAGLHRRSPLLAASMTLAMVSLAGIPPMAGFFGKFLLLKAVIEQGAVASRLLLPGLHRHGRRGHFALLLLRRRPRHLLVGRARGPLSHPGLGAHPRHPLRLHRRHVLPRALPRPPREPGRRGGQGASLALAHLEHILVGLDSRRSATVNSQSPFTRAPKQRNL